MRKKIIEPVRQQPASLDAEWLNLESLAEVEITSEHADHPIEFALLPGQAAGWRAAEPGKQTIRLLFSHPQRIERIWLHFLESGAERTQEYVLRWSADGGKSFQEIVRQQWNFNPRGATTEVEDYHVELPAVTVLELSIIPDIGDNSVTASLEQLRLA